MSFIKEIQPYIERIKLHQQGGRITNIDILREIRDIHFKYIRSNDFDTPSNLGCNNCVRQMINQLVGEIGREEQAQIKRAKENTTFNKGSKEPIKTGHKMTFPKQEPLKDIESRFEKELTGSDNAGAIYGWDDNYKAMKWGAFKKYCTSKGIKVKGKTREVLENELKGL